MPGRRWPTVNSPQVRLGFQCRGQVLMQHCTGAGCWPMMAGISTVPKFNMFWSFFQSTPQLRTPFNYCILYRYIIVSFFMHAACMRFGPAMDTQTSAYTHNIYIPYTFAHTHTTYVHAHIYIYIFIRDHHHLWGEGVFYIYIYTYIHIHAGSISAVLWLIYAAQPADLLLKEREQKATAVVGRA